MTSPLAYTTKLDVLRDAIAQVEASDYVADGIVVHSADWAAIQLAKISSSDERYSVGDPALSNAHMLWGLPVVVTNSIASGTFLVGSFQQAAQLWDREEASITVGLNNDNFTRNMVTILAEERLALTIYRAAALVGGSFAVT